MNLEKTKEVKRKTREVLCVFFLQKLSEESIPRKKEWSAMSNAAKKS